MTSQLRIVTFPDDDPTFVAQVRDAFGALGATDGISAEKLVDVLRTLLPVYPRVEIHQQDGLASFETDPRTWYVFRDGSLMRYDERSNGPERPV